MNHSLTTRYVARPTSRGRDVRIRTGLWMEQIKPNINAVKPNLADLHRMWIYSASGRAAALLRSLNCPVEFNGSTINVYLGVYIWPSRPDLNFTLTISQGELSGLSAVIRPRAFSVFVNNANWVELKYYSESIISKQWESPTYDRFGERITYPTSTLIDNKLLEFGSEVFGALRVRAMVNGYHVLVKLSFDKSITEIDVIPEAPGNYTLITDTTVDPLPPHVQNADRISNVAATITATWVDDQGDEQNTSETNQSQLSLELPQCVQDLLDMCPDMFETITLICREERGRTVWWNPCSESATVVEDDEGQTFCQRIAGSDSLWYDSNLADFKDF